MSSNPIAQDSLSVIAEFGKSEAFKQLFDALQAGCVLDWKVAPTPERREQHWHELQAAIALRARILKITKSES